ncbi:MULTISPECIES: AI-2E family transporter [Clostridium]|uniref:AI-2E family transporter n=1 Tax=Clostridium TaxID=1485 RepID=UPI000824EE64|nr:MULTISPECIES: AI-2E family transporter [Clostridium]PJI10184.1 AI-2E family transporter [Clostridium sp. CT7]
MKEYKKLIECFALLCAFIVFTLLIKKYFKPFFVIILFVILCSPIHKFLCGYKIFNNKLSAIISIVFVNLMIFFGVFLMGNFIMSKITMYFINPYNKININKLPIISKFNINILMGKLNIFSDKLLNTDFFRKGAFYTTDSILTYFVATISVYFILADKYDIVNLTEKLLTKNKVQLILKKLNDIKNLLIVETFLVLITTVETIIGFFILGINDFFMLGIICGFLDILPYVGTILVFIPLMIYYACKKEYLIVFGLAILYIFLQFIRQIMEAKFMSNKFKVHPLLIIVSVYIGIKAFGIIGLFMGPIYVISAKEIILSS